jgi:hypothetical protein
MVAPLSEGAMRHFAFAFALLALGACGERQTSSTAAADGCAREAAHEVTWSDANAPDTVTARSFGPSCAQAVVLLVARNANGDALWQSSSTYHEMNGGGVPPIDATPVTDEDMDRFLRGWADVTVTTTNALPEWREGSATIGDEGALLSYDSSLARPGYEALRAQNLRVICYAVALETSNCLIIDPVSGAPIQIAASGI